MQSKKRKEYRLAHLEERKEADKQYYQNNKENQINKSRIWYRENKEKSKATKAKYYQNNKEKIDNAKKKWHEKNKEKMKQWVNKYMINRYHTNFDYRVKTIINKRIRDYVRLKNNSTLLILGCSIEQFKKWIEYQFDENMNWENMGSYLGFGHVIPCSSFDFSDEEQI